jgi:hypothetical protein
MGEFNEKCKKDVDRVVIECYTAFDLAMVGGGRSGGEQA